MNPGSEHIRVLGGSRLLMKTGRKERGREEEKEGRREGGREGKMEGRREGKRFLKTGFLTRCLVLW